MTSSLFIQRIRIVKQQESQREQSSVNSAFKMTKLPMQPSNQVHSEIDLHHNLKQSHPDDEEPGVSGSLGQRMGESREICTSFFLRHGNIWNLEVEYTVGSLLSSYIQ